jgi:hypothetical protein
MELKAPSNGVITYMSNYSQGWMNAKPFKVGRSDLGGQRNRGAAGPRDAANQGEARRRSIAGAWWWAMDARILIDPFPEKPFEGKLSAISPMVEQSWGEWPPQRNFKAQATFNVPDKRLRPGMNGRMDIVVERIPNAISVSRRRRVSAAGSSDRFRAGERRLEAARSRNSGAQSG